MGIPRARNNKDSNKNRYGAMLFDMFRGNDLFILNCRIKDDTEGNYTCKNVSVVDYCNSNIYFIGNVKTVTVLDFSSLFSDVHCPLPICITCNDNRSENSNMNLFDDNKELKHWNSDITFDYQLNVNEEKVHKLSVNLSNTTCMTKFTVAITSNLS